MSWAGRFMDCGKARMLAEVRGNRESELPAEDAAVLDQHLSACPDCQRILENERRFDEPIAQAMRAVTVPSGLKMKLLGRLARERGAVHRRRFFYAAAAVACVVIGIGILNWNQPNRPKLDLNGLVQLEDHRIEQPKEAAEEWLAAQGIQFHPPVDLNPRLLATHGSVTVQGKQVPTLYYRTHSAYAKVFIFRDTDFDLSSLPETWSGSSVFGHQVKVFRDAQHPTKQVYVVLFTGDSLEPFLNRFQPI